MNVKEIKINHILEQGFELFSKEGIDNVTMNNIADKAEIGVASLYRYFSTKEELPNSSITSHVIVKYESS